jgi:hypothetical protein
LEAERSLHTNSVCRFVVKVRPFEVGGTASSVYDDYGKQLC